MSDDRSSVGGRDPAWADTQARLTGAAQEARRQSPTARALRAAPRDAVRVFEEAMRRAQTPGRRNRDTAGEGGAPGGDPFGQASADVPDHGFAGASGHEFDREFDDGHEDGVASGSDAGSDAGSNAASDAASNAASDAALEAASDVASGADTASGHDADAASPGATSRGDLRGRLDTAARGQHDARAADRRYGYPHGRQHDRDHGKRDRDAAACMQDVWSLFATGAIGPAVSGAVPPTAPAPRDIVDDLFALVVALRGDASGTAVIELDLDDRTLPGVSIRIAQDDARLCFTFLCRQAEGFRRLVAHAATLAELLHERLARPVGVAVRRIRDGAHAAAGGDVDVDVEAG